LKEEQADVASVSKGDSTCWSPNRADVKDCPNSATAACKQR